LPRLAGVALSHSLPLPPRLQPLPAEVLDSYRRSGVALSYSLSSFLPMVNLSCPQLVVTMPVR
jgi:hypothetical protein